MHATEGAKRERSWPTGLIPDGRSRKQSFALSWRRTTPFRGLHGSTARSASVTGQRHGRLLRHAAANICCRCFRDRSASYVFPSIRTSKRPMSDNTINAALRRLGYSTHEMTAHGFRAMATTLLNECGKWHPMRLSARWHMAMPTRCAQHIIAARIGTSASR